EDRLAVEEPETPVVAERIEAVETAVAASPLALEAAPESEACEQVPGEAETAEAAVLDLLVAETFQPEPEPAGAASAATEDGPVAPVELAAPVSKSEPAPLDMPVVAEEPEPTPQTTADVRLTPLVDSLAETVLALGRDASHGDADLAAHRDAVATWLSEFEREAGLPPAARATAAPVPVSPPADVERVPREAERRREALLRAAIEAEVRLQVEDEFRSRIAEDRTGSETPFVSIVRRVARQTRAGVPAPSAQAVSDEDAEMREVFALEAAEHLKRIDADAAGLRVNPSDVERLRSLRRAVHTLKGAAAMMGFSAVADLSHSLEDRLDAATSEGASLDDAALANLLGDLDRLEGLVAGSPAVPAAAEAQELATATTEPAETASGPVAVPLRLEKLDQLLTLAGEASVSVSRWPAIVAHANGALGELRRTAARVETLLTALQSERHRRLEEDGRNAMRPVAQHQTDFDALELDRYTPTDYVAHELAQIAAETGAAERELAASIENAAELAEAQRRQASEIQERLLEARLVPLGELEGRLQRSVHGVALRRAKHVELVVEGAEVAVDRAVLDAVGDALQHLVRNAVDHGIETPAAREERGKPATGTVCVSARQTQGEVVIEVTDDGAGIDIERVSAAARAAGLDEARDARAALELIFHPGLTTARAVDDVSGRGVGLDAVAEAMQRIHGSVEVASEVGSGTIFNLRFPVTLAQARVVMAEAAGNPVALPAASVKHVTRLSDARVERDGEGASAILGGQRYPLASLATVLGWPADGAPLDPPLVFVEAGTRRAAWTADFIGSHADVVVKSLGGHLGRPRGVGGASLLQDGRVALMLHLPDLLTAQPSAGDWALRMPVGQAARGADRGAHRSPQLPGAMRVLVVDDSPTIRKLLVRMLRDLGWQPREAKDGAEALEAIRVDRPDAVLADIEMPRLDGYGLLSALRAQPATAELPVLMLTSRTAERHRTRAMELGANGYLTKPYRPEDVASALRQLAGVR
ncbi:MAG TPA: response regulator, partial [Chloroflexota bacterium]|nr:response regulator [Chloroflexota bacterium]